MLTVEQIAAKACLSVHTIRAPLDAKAAPAVDCDGTRLVRWEDWSCLSPPVRCRSGSRRRSDPPRRVFVRERTVLTPAECAARARVSLSLIYALLRKKKIPALRVGLGRGKWLIKEEDFEAFLTSCKQEDLIESESEFKYL